MLHRWSSPAVRWAVAVAGILSLPAFAQFTSGDIIGTIRDATRSVTPDAKVTVTNERTNATRTVTSDSMGNYDVRQLQQDSTYRVEVEKSGFKKTAVSGVALGTAQVRRVDLTLEVGEVTQSIEVTQQAPAVQSESATIGIYTPTIALDKDITPTPNYGIPIYSLAWQPGSAAGTQAHTLFNGSRLSQHSTNVDGVKYNMFSRGGPMEAIQDVQAVTLNAPAEYDRSIVMNVIYRGGTRQYHGEFQTAYSSPWMNAREWFSHVPRSIGNGGLPRWQYSTGVGGPVPVPRLKDRLFFYFTYQKDRSTQSVYPVVRSLPTLSMQRGDFSRYPRTITDPESRQPFPGNVIPQSVISHAARVFIEDWYAGNWNYSTPDSFTNNATQTGGGKGFSRAYSVKVDYNLSDKDIFGFSGHNTSEGGGGTRTGSSGNWLPTLVGSPYAVELQSAHYTRILTPGIVNQLRIGHYRNGSLSENVDRQTGAPVYGDQLVTKLGLRGIPASPNVTGGPYIIFASDQWPSLGPVFSGGRNFNNNFQVYDNLTVIRGRHTLKTGFQGIKYFRDGVANSSWRFGRFDFNGRFTNESFADFLLGFPSGSTRWRPRGANIAERMEEFGAYGQDDFRVSSRLTVSYGLRWGMFTVPEDANGLYYNVDTTGTSVSIVVPNEHARENVNAAWPTSDIPVKLASEAGFQPKLLPRRMSWQPRLGFAFRPLGTATTVIRGGYGVYSFSLNEQSGSGLLQTGGPFAIDEQFVNAPAGQAESFRWPDAFPPGVVRLAGSNVSLLAYDRQWRLPYTQQWNLTFEKQLKYNWGARISYVGTKSTQLSYSRSANIPVVSAVPYTDARRPWQNVRALTIRENGGDDRYQALQVVVQHPWSKGLWINAGYTYSWSKTDAHPSTFELAASTSTADYAYDRRRDTGANRFWPSHDFVASYVYDVPLAAGRNVVKNLVGNSWAGRLFNGIFANWTASGYFSVHSGSFFNPTFAGADPGNINQFSGRPNLKPGCDPMAGGRTHGQWFNPACYELPGPGQFGNAIVNSLRGPRQWILTLNPYKEFPLGIREGMKIRLGASVWNTLNHPSFATPIANIRDPNAGKVLGNDWQRSWGPWRGSRKIVIIGKFIF